MALESTMDTFGKSDMDMSARLSFFSSIVKTAKGVHSLPVPQVVGMAMTGTPSVSSLLRLM